MCREIGIKGRWRRDWQLGFRGGSAGKFLSVPFLVGRDQFQKVYWICNVSRPRGRPVGDQRRRSKGRLWRVKIHWFHFGGQREVGRYYSLFWSRIEKRRKDIVRFEVPKESFLLKILEIIYQKRWIGRWEDMKQGGMGLNLFSRKEVWWRFSKEMDNCYFRFGIWDNFRSAAYNSDLVFQKYRYHKNVNFEFLWSEWLLTDTNPCCNSLHWSCEKSRSMGSHQ